MQKKLLYRIEGSGGLATYSIQDQVKWSQLHRPTLTFKGSPEAFYQANIHIFVAVSSQPEGNLCLCTWSSKFHVEKPQPELKQNPYCCETMVLITTPLRSPYFDLMAPFFLTLNTHPLYPFLF